MQPEYTLSLALVDFLPIIFSAFGLYYVACMVTHLGRIQGHMAMLGVVLIILGGTFTGLYPFDMLRKVRVEREKR